MKLVISYPSPAEALAKARQFSVLSWKAFSLFLLPSSLLFFSSSGFAQRTGLFLNDDTALINKIECWSFEKMTIRFQYDKKVTEGTELGVVLSVQNRYNTLNFIGGLDVKEVRTEGKKKGFVEVPVFTMYDPREETGFSALMSGALLTRGAIYYEIDDKGEDTTWLTVSVVIMEKLNDDKGDDEDDDKKKEEDDGEMIGMYAVVMKSKPIMMLNRSWITGLEWSTAPDIPFPAGNCSGFKLPSFPDGEWTRKNSKGDIVVRGQYLGGQRHGTWLQYSETDGKTLREIRHYTNGVVNGYCTRFNDKGIIREKGNYLDGKRHGTWFVFSDTGEPETIYEYSKGQLIAAPYPIIETHRKTGKKDKDGEETGIWVTTNPQVIDSITYSGGKKEGYAAKYYQGILESRGNYADGDKNGVWYNYTEFGELYHVITYKSDSKDGSYKAYEEGCLKEEGQYNNNERDGLWKFYDCSNYYLKLEETFKMGEREGPYRTFHENGKLKSEGSWKNNNRHGLYKEYHENGKLAEIGNYEDNSAVGEWRYYYDDGQLKETKTY
jgi:antitoxin component YwqK of YwqJK toxin-antitoxin module